jgi:hypothetical protein
MTLFQVWITETFWRFIIPNAQRARPRNHRVFMDKRELLFGRGPINQFMIAWSAGFANFNLIDCCPLIRRNRGVRRVQCDRKVLLAMFGKSVNAGLANLS